jgi:alkylhydroperoxidase/carboxymuconolactone decarboxylase family protein YurZ
MANDKDWWDGLAARYGREAVENARRLRPHDFRYLAEWRDTLDPEYTRVWLDFTFGGLLARRVLDDRTRYLVTIAQFTVMGELEELDGEIRGAIANGVDPQEILEAIIQTSVYCGHPRTNRAGKLFTEIAAELGLLDKLAKNPPPIKERDAARDLEKERADWVVTEKDFPRREALLKKYGWRGISTGLRVQQQQHADAVDRLDKTSPSFLQLWLDFIYEGLYSRGVLDDRTRILLMVGNCVALRETVQTEHHMKGAMRNGATPKEVLEVLLQSTQHVGMVGTLNTFRILQKVLAEQGRLDEIRE